MTAPGYLIATDNISHLEDPSNSCICPHIEPVSSRPGHRQPRKLIGTDETDPSSKQILVAQQHCVLPDPVKAPALQGGQRRALPDSHCSGLSRAGRGLPDLCCPLLPLIVPSEGISCELSVIRPLGK
ncbi:hypothetical protein CLAIMM_13713 isoform 2 [Cladophialophora immunda]|nr:hypothetical protein CLAIMM_13713 isoform 1 [Cladophialophora immunda]OQV09608.1 hypothetical protein CLAIMM_13713 isoform 2 [Cladophialophora immunda]